MKNVDNREKSKEIKESMKIEAIQNRTFSLFHWSSIFKMNQKQLYDWFRLRFDFFRLHTLSSYCMMHILYYSASSIIRTSIIRTPNLAASRAQFNPFLRGYKLMKFSFRWLLIFVDKFCCDYHEYLTQKGIFVSAVVSSSVMPKNCPFGGMEKNQKTVLYYPNFRYIRTARLSIEFSLFG